MKLNNILFSNDKEIANRDDCAKRNHDSAIRVLLKLKVLCCRRWVLKDHMNQLSRARFEGDVCKLSKAFSGLAYYGFSNQLLREFLFFFRHVYPASQC